MKYVKSVGVSCCADGCTISDEKIMTMANKVVGRRFRKRRKLGSVEDSRQYLSVKFADYENEVFAVIFLDNGNGIISFDQLFRGTIDGASVYPREVVKDALKYNAAAVVLVHNHPSGSAEPSQADKLITQRLKEALGMLDIRVLDHLIVAGTETVSFAEKGLI